MTDLYACPKCNQAFWPIANPKSLKCCPRCGKATLKSDHVLEYD